MSTLTSSSQIQTKHLRNVKTSNTFILSSPHNKSVLEKAMKFLTPHPMTIICQNKHYYAICIQNWHKLEPTNQHHCKVYLYTVNFDTYMLQCPLCLTHICNTNYLFNCSQVLTQYNASEEYSLEGAKYYDTASTVRLFEPPTLDLTVNSYYKMVNLTSCHQQPPVIEHLTDLDIEQCRIRPLQLDHPCHNQCVERHVKMVTEAAAQVEGFE